LSARGEPLVTRVALIGLPGAGKSAVAPILARRLGCPGADLDREVERRAGRAVGAIFEDEGEERFRDLESLALAEALGGGGSLVLACGGGILGRAANRDLLKSRARVVWLSVDPGEAAKRLRTSGAEERPLLSGSAPAERLRALLELRRAAYAAAADATVDTDGLDPEEVADSVLARLRGPGL
jgi:shikimate kinase